MFVHVSVNKCRDGSSVHVKSFHSGRRLHAGAAARSADRGAAPQPGTGHMNQLRLVTDNTLFLNQARVHAKMSIHSVEGKKKKRNNKASPSVHKV